MANLSLLRRNHAPARPPGFERFLQTPRFRTLLRRRRSECSRRACWLRPAAPPMSPRCRKTRLAMLRLPSCAVSASNLEDYSGRRSHGDLLSGGRRQSAPLKGSLRPRQQRHRACQARATRLGLDLRWRGVWFRVAALLRRSANRHRDLARNRSARRGGRAVDRVMRFELPQESVEVGPAPRAT